MAHLLTAALLYGALITQVTLRYGGAGPWTPSLLLLAGLGAARRLRGGIVWAAAAGLVCDSLSGRPLGVTMLSATLVAALVRSSSGAATAPPAFRQMVAIFLSVAGVEAAGRVLGATVLSRPDYLAECLEATQTAFVTAGVAAVGLLLRRTMSKLVQQVPGGTADRFRVPVTRR